MSSITLQGADTLKTGTVIRVGTALYLALGALFPDPGQWLAGACVVPSQEAAQLWTAVVAVAARPANFVPLVRVLTEQNVVLHKSFVVGRNFELQLRRKRSRQRRTGTDQDHGPRTSCHR